LAHYKVACECATEMYILFDLLYLFLSSPTFHFCFPFISSVIVLMMMLTNNNNNHYRSLST